MTTYKVSGKINLGREENNFEREVEAETEKHAEEKTYSELGSEHSKNRSNITIEQIEEA